VVARGVAGGGMAKRLAVAEADLEDARGAAPEYRVEVARRAAEVEAEPRPQRIEGALLGGREAALPEHEAAHAAAAVLDREGLGRRLGPGAGEGIGRRPGVSRPGRRPARRRWRSACAGCARRGTRRARPPPPASWRAP